MPIPLKSPQAIALLREGAQILSRLHGELATHIRPGITTQALDTIAEAYLLAHNAKPSFKGYDGFPATLCISVNEEVIHGTPGPRVLQAGDIVSIDCGVYYKGYHTDSAYTHAVGEVDKKIVHLLSVTKEAVYKGIQKAIAGNRLGDIGHAIYHHGSSHGYGVVTSFGGHGIGEKLHEEPQVLNFGKQGNGVRLRDGMVLAIEPMFTMGTETLVHRRKQSAVCTQDGQPAAHFEHTIAIVHGKPEILTTFEYIETRKNS